METESYSASASFGSLNTSTYHKGRSLKVDVREGDYTLDSWTPTGGSGESLTTDNDYDAIRHTVWLQTDEAFKDAVHSIATKKAYLQEHNIKDLTDSWSRETPVVSMEAPSSLNIDREKRSENVRKLSAVFRKFPKVQRSTVRLDERAKTRWYINNEGFQSRTRKDEVLLSIIATAQVEGGGTVADAELIAGKEDGDLPPYEELEKRARALAERVVKLAEAPELEQYRGPVIFEGQASADFFGDVLQANLGHSAETLGQPSFMSMSHGNPLADKIGTKILPSFISVVDDPLSRHFGNSKTPICSTYDIDDDGMRATKLNLVENGVLKTFAMSRAPSREIKQSNGHAVGGAGAAINLYIFAEKKLSPSKLKQKLMVLGKDDDLKEVLVVKRLTNLFVLGLDPKAAITRLMSSMMGGSGVRLTPANEVYKVNLKDGKEQLVRTGAFTNVTLRVLRDIVAAGDDMKPYPMLGMNNVALSRGSQLVSTVVTPSILIKEIELQKPSKQSDLPTVLKNPNFE
jgi:TldD protein